MPGDFDREQAEEVIRWADSILDEPVTMPVCMDGDLLHGRLKALRDYIVKQIELQREVHDDDDQARLLSRHDQCDLGVAGLPLRAPAWTRVDSELNLDIPRRLTMLAAIKNDELRSSELRKRILETPDSWPFLLVKPKST